MPPTLQDLPDSRMADTVAPPHQWSVAHTPAANVQATASKAAGGAGVRHVCTSIVASFRGGAAAPAAAIAIVELRDGASGAGTVLWSERLTVQATAGIAGSFVNLSGLAIKGTANTAMTLEFQAAGGANTLQSVALTGYDVEE